MDAAKQDAVTKSRPSAVGTASEDMVAPQQVASVLVIEDDPDTSSLLVYTLENAGYRVTAETECSSAWQSMTTSEPDMILLDWMLPDMSGIELLRRIRGYNGLSEVPVFMLTARGEEMDRVRGLESGADDYIVKPFSPRELCARISSRLRVQQGESSRALSTDGLLLDQQSYRVSVEGMVVTLGPTEFRLLRHFMSNKERVMTRNQLLDSVWGTNVYIEERTVDVHVRRLRKALEPFGKSDLVQTVRGVGYRFSDQG
ncbi:MAG: phosphate regulon transcriptional regulator PhoB [Gammaproteobacteria bacterium]